MISDQKILFMANVSKKLYTGEGVLVTGGSGLLGGELKKLLPKATFPSSREFDVTNNEQMERYIAKKKFTTILHAAAFTSPPKVEQDPQRAIAVNIIGAANVTSLAAKNNYKLIYISTDYVFKGNKGMYKEDDFVYPVNKYAWSKLGGECSVRLYDNSLIIRTSFGPSPFPYDQAFADQWTSREAVSVIAEKILKLLASDLVGIIHVGGRRKSVYEYAREISPEKKIQKISRTTVSFTVPKDTSLNVNKFNTQVQKDGK